MNGNRIHYLDGLRGVLAMIVFVHHFLYIFYPEAMLGGPVREFMQPGITFWKVIAFTPINILFNPHMAINFFFLLSGYVQSYHYLKNPDLKLLQMSFVKRYFRLAIPTLAVVLLIFVFRKLHLLHKDLLPNNPITAGWVKTQLPGTLNFLQLIKYALFDCFQGDRSYYQVLWTMPVELLNSWMVLVLLMVTHHFKYKMKLYLFWLAVQLFVLGSTHSLLFTFGLMLCHLGLHAPKFKTLLSSPAVKYGCLLLGLYIASFPYFSYDKGLENTIYEPIAFFDKDRLHIFSYIIGNIFLFCFILHSNGVKIMFSKKPFQFFGSISLMFYLVHFLLLFSVSAWLHFKLRGLALGGNLVVTFILTFAAVTGLSYVLTRYVDAPSLKYGNRYVKKLFYE